VKPPNDLGVERDVATGTDAATSRSRVRRYSNLRMPHERDESTHAPREPDDVTKQALEDIESGKQETDCYGAAGGRFDRKEGER
jgi:hypothetical protein